MEFFEMDDEDEPVKETVKFNRNFQFLDLSLEKTHHPNDGGDNVGGNENSVAGHIAGDIENRVLCFEKQHMFDKVVTPSDVGKLNRLVIPKQHAEKYFPLDSSSNEKGLLLNFEDRTGKQWRFRYSYWNSSQSYVMTKGWSRFVKDKKLDAGDVVSFERGVGEIGKDLLFIDWKRRPEVMKTASFLPLKLPEFVRWGNGSPAVNQIFRRNEYLRQVSYNVHPYYYLRPSSSGQIPAVGDGSEIPVVMNSVKRLRLFGVNMECQTTPEDAHIPACSVPPRDLGFQKEDRRRQISPEFLNKGKSSLSFDLDL